MDVVLVGLPGSGKTAVGRRLAARHKAPFVDLDDTIEREAGRRIPEIFADEGEAGFRSRERAAIAALGDGDPGPRVTRVVATGGGAVVDPRNRWSLYRRGLVVWLDGRPEVLAQRLRASPHVRPLIQGRDPIRSIRELGAARARFYGAGVRVGGVAEAGTVVEAVDRALASAFDARSDGGTLLLRAETSIGRFLLGSGIAGSALADELRRLSARRAVVVSEPGAWGAVGGALTEALARAAIPLETVLLPQGEEAKRLSIVEAAARDLVRLRVERGEPLVAVGGGALGDTAGFLAATYLRGVPFIQLPTTLVGQIDSAIGGKTGVDLPEGKNLVGSFHQPAAIVIDVALLETLPVRERRAALAEAVKMAALGDDRLFGVLEEDGPALADGAPSAFRSGALAEVVERAGWAKVEVVAADEREAGRRISLNLGHSLGHAIEAAGGYADLRHGEAVAYGLRAASRIGVELGVTPPERAARIEALLDRLELGRGTLPYPLETVLGHLATDKKHAGGSLRWVLPTARSHEVRADVPETLVARVASELLEPAGAGVPGPA
jgi:3-dehydroquinate synthetase/shikimate kinase